MPQFFIEAPAGIRPDPARLLPGAPELPSVDARRTPSAHIHAAVHDAYDGLASTAGT
jgi:hypothetical protein